VEVAGLLGISLVAYAAATDAAAAGPLSTEALACTERSGDLLIEQTLHHLIGWDALETGDLLGARVHMEAAIRGAEAIGFAHAETTLNLGWVLRAEHDLDGARSALQEALRIGRRIGARKDMAEAILVLACLAGDLGDWPRAAVRHGAAQVLLDQTGVPWDTFVAEIRQESLDQARAALGDEPFQRAYAHGMALSFDQTISLALDQIPPSP
jgi:hypothetical protein